MPRVARLHVCSGCCRCECEEHLLNRPFGGNRKLDSFENLIFFLGRSREGRKRLKYITPIFSKRIKLVVIFLGFELEGHAQIN